MFFQETLGNNFRECGWEDGASTVARLRGTRNLNGRHNRVKLHAHQTQEVGEGGGGFTGAKRPWDGDGVGCGTWGWVGAVPGVVGCGTHCSKNQTNFCENSRKFIFVFNARS